MSEAMQFVSERIKPGADSFDPSAMTRGEPALPRRFRWRQREVVVRDVLATWKDHGDCRHGSGERYLRRHWFHIRTDDDAEMKLYFERQPQSRRSAKSRWWIYSVEGK